jgi:hypothetical protein
MPDSIGERLNLDLAWHRTKRYKPERSFVVHPFLGRWVEQNLTSWLQSIKKSLDAGYSPREGSPCFMPKPKGMLRKGIVLDLRDEVVYTSLLGEFCKAIWEKVAWSQGGPDMAYKMVEPSGEVEWIENRLNNWKEWTRKSLQLLEQGNRYVLFTDICNFYDNIDLNLLGSYLRELSLDSQFVDLAMLCLRRWSTPNGRGIPQGYTASDLLGKLYMNSIDIALKDKGLVHLRYMDDIRVFCATKHEAKQALADLTILLVQKGLALNTEKTDILPVEKARGKIAGVSGVIDNLHKEMRNAQGLDDYATEVEIEEEFKKNPSRVPSTIFEALFLERFAITDADFDKTLLHYLLTRLAAVRSTVAVKYCLQMIHDRPDEMDYVLKYLRSVHLDDSDISDITSFMSSDEAIYDYQLYQIVRWFVDINRLPNELVSLYRHWAFDRNREPWLRTYSLLALARDGNDADLERMEENYNTAPTKCEKSEIVTCLERMEKSRRNRFYTRVKNDSDLVLRAIELAKQGSCLWRA